MLQKKIQSLELKIHTENDHFIFYSHIFYTNFDDEPIALRNGKKITCI